MTKSFFLMSIVLVVSGCVSNGPAPDSDGVNAGITAAQSVAASEFVADGSSVSASEADSVPEQVEPDPSMEVVEVEGFKEKCTMERVTGSRIPQKYCRPVGADDRQREAAKGWLDATKRKPLGLTPGQKG